jgi:glutathione peroxidase
MSQSALYDLPVQRISGESTSLAEYRGKVLLIVNVASKCGLTAQYDALEDLYERFRESGFVVLGFPANDFAGQEPGSNEEIHTFCRSTFSVDFPMFSKIAVTGPNADPLYKTLTAAIPTATTTTASKPFRDGITGYLATIGQTPTTPPEILWNFEKFIVDRNGNVVARFSPEVLPDDPAVIAAIEAALQS